MRNFIFLLTASMIISSCVQASGSKEGGRRDTTAAAKLFTLADAEKIMGEPVHLTDNSGKHDGGALRHLYGYQANIKAPESDRPGAIYFLFEQFDQLSLAQKRYTDTKTSNEHNGIKTLDNLGDEAYFHTDNQNFYFIMVRKGNSVFNLKVNKITPTTSLDQFNQIAKKIAATI